jgi:RNA polymerase sigma-70 factor, ECF subfamily
MTRVRKRSRVLKHPGFMRVEGEVVRLPVGHVEARGRFDEFFEDEHERLYKALYFVTGNRSDAEDLMQDAFMRLWERWDHIDRIADPTGYLFRVALNGFRMRHRRAATALRKLAQPVDGPDLFAEAEMRADVQRLLLGLTVRQRAALLLVDLLGYPSKEAARILHVRPSTVRALATKGRKTLRSKKGARDA